MTPTAPGRFSITTDCPLKFRHARDEEAAQNVGAAAGGETDDDLDGTAWINLLRAALNGEATALPQQPDQLRQPHAGS